MARKRKRHDGEDAIDQEEAISTRKRTRAGYANGNHSGDDAASNSTSPEKTPTKARRGRPPGSTQKAKAHPNGLDPISQQVAPLESMGDGPFSTPIKATSGANGHNAAPIVGNADRSARRKSARTIVERTATNKYSDDEDAEEEDLLARKIWDADEAESEDQQEEAEGELGADDTVPTTPSKRKSGRRKKSPTPPQNLPFHEQYFWQNRPGKIKTSNNTLSSLSLLTHEAYHDQINAYEDPHTSSYAFLHSLHSRSFPQWRFELSQSFNICLYGYGSKRKLVTAFAKYLHTNSPSKPPRIFIINGYTPTLTVRQVINTFATFVFECTPGTLPSKFGTQPREILTTLTNHLNTYPPLSPYFIFINSLDAPPLRRFPNPSLLAQLAASPYIHLLATCDTPNFPLLWDTKLRDQYNFLFHDTTTFESYSPVEIGSVIEDVNELLGRSGRSIKGKEGVGFVLRSLPENARSLYRVLLGELLAAMDEEGGGEGGIEYKVLYQKVVEEFICSNEMGFRQLLKEFYDHQMVVSRRDGSGAELLGVPWRREEMEAILEDLVL
ncbi:MAG: Origin recognition complex subunit 2 [Alectoria fallacina]|uniref:Origin recognition complex subunit 2 n=1 Tax=Alectoria fallacina TaxID=1903189 RepID=A0A8H3F3I4_9LECA|nr:MAG: Origin recognition complex subunit 2 [Alectoria fallacina]